MAKYLDYQLEKSDYDSAKEYKDGDALVLAIRNLLLSRPGNFPFHPSVGVNIKKYQFEFLDDTEVRTIQKEIDRAISECIPNIDAVSTIVRKIEKDNHVYLAISINSTLNGTDSTANFLLTQEHDDIKIFNEIY